MSRKRIAATVLAVASLLLVAPVAMAHFVWIDTDTHGDMTQVSSGFGHPGDWEAHLAPSMAAAKYWSIDTSGNATPFEMTFDKKAEAYQGKVSSKGPMAIVGNLTYGLYGESPEKQALVQYSFKRLVGTPADWAQFANPQNVTVDITPALTAKGIDFTVTSAGKPLADAKVSIWLPKGGHKELKTDAEGKATLDSTEPGVYNLYSGHRVMRPGTYEGKDYKMVMDYATLTFDVPAKAEGSASR